MAVSSSFKLLKRRRGEQLLYTIYMTVHCILFRKQFSAKSVYTGLDGESTLLPRIEVALFLLLQHIQEPSSKQYRPPPRLKALIAKDAYECSPVT